MSKNIPDLSSKLTEFMRSIDQLQKYEKVDKNGIIKEALQGASFLIPTSSTTLATRLDLATKYIQDLDKEIESQKHSETPLTPEEVVKRKRFNARKSKLRLLSYRLIGAGIPSFLFIYKFYMDALEGYKLVSSGRAELDSTTTPDWNFENAIFNALIVGGWFIGGYIGKYCDKSVSKIDTSNKGENYPFQITLTLGLAYWGSISEFFFHELELIFNNGYRGEAIEHTITYIVFNLAFFSLYLIFMYILVLIGGGFIQEWRREH
jgi:hypothetical protein